MEQIRYQKIKLSETQKISEIDASIYIKNAWRTIDGDKKLIFLDYHEMGFPSGIDEHKNALENTIRNGGYAVGAFNKDGLLIGFLTLNRETFGTNYSYVLLDQLFISKQYRYQGIGKKLMNLCIQEAKFWGVDRIYICAGSSEDTITFYEAVGCREAEEINQELFDSDPRDFQLEYVIKNTNCNDDL